MKKKGFFKKFFGGLMKAIGSFINAIVEVFFKIPILALMFSWVLAIGIVAAKMIGGKVLLIAKSIFKAMVTAFILWNAPMAFGGQAGAWGGAGSLVAGANTGLFTLGNLASLASFGKSVLGNYNQYKLDEQQSRFEKSRDQQIEDITSNPITSINSNNLGDVTEWEYRYHIMYNAMFDTEAMTQIAFNRDTPEGGSQNLL